MASFKQTAVLHLTAYAIVASFFYLAAYMSMRQGIVWPTNPHADPERLMKATNPKHFYLIFVLYLVIATTFLGGALFMAHAFLTKHR